MKRRTWVWLTLGLILLLLAAVAAYELVASPVQAMLLADYAKRLTYRTEPGPSDRVRFPDSGPYDQRFGYVALPDIRKRLEARGFLVEAQARLSPEMMQLAAYGLFLPYREKNSAGLVLESCSGEPLFSFRQPQRIYPDFKAIPPVVANTLLFIENRELLDPNHPQRNPAVEWDRLAQAMLEKLVQVVQPGRNVPGGSTLATQIEKYRHSPDGLTLTPADKLRQMASASVRAYLDGVDTRVTRRRIVLDYLNTVPLAAAPGYGEVHGLGDALDAWFGLDFDRVNQLLSQPEGTAEAARVYKHVLGLLISQRKPSWYLLGGRAQLDAQADVHLGLLAEAGVISPAFRDLARNQKIVFAQGKASRPTPRAIDKVAASTRVELSRILGVPSLYDLDRLDLTVSTSVHKASQAAVSQFLRSLKDPEAVKAAGLFGENLLSPGNDLGKVLYSLTLHELTEAGPVLRVQADSLDQPFDINQGAKLDMGSSAKLRTLLTYLQLLSELHGQYAGMQTKELNKLTIPERDVLTRWVIGYLRQNPERGLEPMLMAAMGRLYSADPSEVFFTGGGQHSFANFKKEDNGRVMDLWEATRNSVNLPFIRLMRDLVRHFMYRAPGTVARVLEDVEDPRRQSYLEKFADKEGQTFLAKFWKKYRGLSPEATTDMLLNHLSAHPVRLAAVFRYMEPGAGLAEFRAFMEARHANPAGWDDADLRKLYDDYGPERYNLADRAYIVQIHPLELWLAAYLRKHPGAPWKQLVEASTDERIDGYDWLFKTGRKNAQDIRIQSLLEIEAFQEIHQRWRKLGYPFASLVPSYATAIGSSADRPAALAEMMGVILNDGVRQDPATIERLEFAAGTPYHTRMVPGPRQAERIFPPEVARVVRRALVNVVEQGTARRVAGAFVSQGAKLSLGGKTGTGDHRYETYGTNGQVTDSKVVNRVATFAFFIGRRFYGVVTAFVPGEAAAGYKFTSGLPVQILKTLAPTLQPLIGHGEGRPLDWADAVAAFEADHLPATPPQPPTPEPEPAKPAAPVLAGATKPAPPLAANTAAKALPPASPKPVAAPTAPAHPAAPHPVPVVPHPAPAATKPATHADKPAPAPAPGPEIPTPAPATPGRGHEFF